jgi:hypothetical protein
MGFNMEANFSLSIGGPGGLFGGGQNNGPVNFLGGPQFAPPTGIGGDMRSQLLNALADMFQAFGNMFGGGGGQCGQPGQVSPPCPSDCSPSGQGGLTKDDKGVVTTPGGYKIESTGQYDWQITSPDGKVSKIWGDPHVVDGDGTKWDFKKDSTFMLPDGTKIDCKTQDLGNGTSVSKDLTITNGNDRVQITGMDKGKGQTGEITKDGFDHVNDFAGEQVFVMSKDGTDFYKDGKEIEGNENGADTFKLGQANPDLQNPGQMNDVSQLLMQLFQALFGIDLGGNQTGQTGQADAANGAGQQNNGGQEADNANQANPNGAQGGLRMLIQMFKLLGQLAQLLQQFNGQRPMTANV